MPRLPPSLLRYAASHNRHLPRLLRECRDLDAATNELRWLAEYAHDKRVHLANSVSSANARLAHYVHRRSRGEPLQYILGNQPFGKLDILCRHKVLIPRPETELYTIRLAGLLKTLLQHEMVIESQNSIKIADLCTGTGCIALLLNALLKPASSDTQLSAAIDIQGVDVSSDALELARENLKHNLHNGALHVSCYDEVTFRFGDVLELGKRAKRASARSPSDGKEVGPVNSLLGSQLDVIVSNPPYISPLDYAPGGTVDRSVRDFEPKLALVPPVQAAHDDRRVPQADQFYEAALHIARKMGTKLVVLEIGDSAQAQRVRELIRQIMSGGVVIETWRDDGSEDTHCPTEEVQCGDNDPSRANERVVVVWTSWWADWRLKNRS